MIELTDEMVQIVKRLDGADSSTSQEIRRALAAVRAIVERDHDVRLRERDQCLCGADLGHPWDSIPHRRGTPGCRGAS